MNGESQVVLIRQVPRCSPEYDFGQGLSIANYDVTRAGRVIMLRRGSHGGLRLVLN